LNTVQQLYKVLQGGSINTQKKFITSALQLVLAGTAAAEQIAQIDF